MSLLLQSSAIHTRAHLSCKAVPNHPLWPASGSSPFPPCPQVFSVECRGLAERHAASIKAWPGDEEGSLPWCLTVLRQSYNVSDLDPERAAGLAELNDKIHPLNFQAEINAHAASFVKGTREW